MNKYKDMPEVAELTAKYKYTESLSEASTFRSAFLAKEAIAELDGCEFGLKRFHEINYRGDGKIVLKLFVYGVELFFADDIGNRYTNKLND